MCLQEKLIASSLYITGVNPKRDFIIEGYKVLELFFGRASSSNKGIHLFIFSISLSCLCKERAKIVQEDVTDRWKNSRPNWHQCSFHTDWVKYLLSKNNPDSRMLSPS